MSTATVTGTIAYPVALGGPNTSLYLGSPTINSTSSSGPQITFNEGGTTTISVGSAAPVAIPMGTISSANLVYIGSNNPVELTLNGSADTLVIGANGFVILASTAVTEGTLQAVSSSATVTLAVFGD